MTEKELRNLVKKVWGNGPPLTWVEAGRGSTVGAADLLVPVGRQLVPAELKVIKTTHDSFQPVLRPVQLNYHRGLIKNGIASVYLFGVDWHDCPCAYVCDMNVAIEAIMSDKNIEPGNCIEFGHWRHRRTSWVEFSELIKSVCHL